MKNYEKMTVEQLREEMKIRNLPRQKNGKKLVKNELIQALEDYDDDFEGWDDDFEEAVDHPKEEKPATPEEREFTKKRKILFATNYREIVEKYGGRKPQYIYDKMRVGDIIVFVHHVDAEDGNVYRKIRSAKIKSIDRNKETVCLETLLGCNVTITFDEVLFLRKPGRALPPDIRKYLAFKRTRTGREIVKRLVPNEN